MIQIMSYVLMFGVPSVNLFTSCIESNRYHQRKTRTRVEVSNRKTVGAIEFVSRDWDEYILEKLGERLL